jgi:hypothetical protein
MAIPATLADCAGRWAGSNRLQDPPAGILADSPGTAALTPILFGRFLRLDYTWEYRGKPHEGSLLLGGDSAMATGHWIDSWHMGDVVMALRGTTATDGSVSVRGSYAAPPGPDWGWRIDVVPAPDRLRMVMYNISPDGHEELAVEATYTRA